MRYRKDIKTVISLLAQLDTKKKKKIDRWLYGKYREPEQM